jgi:FKBP-type peptidyl-prolyl cis-trans isomerase FkpA
MKPSFKSSIVVAGLATLVSLGSTTGCSRMAGGSGAKPSTEDEKTLYALGLIIGRNVATFNLSPHDLDLVISGLSDSVLKKTPAVELDKYGPKVDELARSRANARATAEKEKAKSIVEAAAREPGAVKTDSGMVIRTTKPGTGETPKPTDRVKVHYTGKLTDGTEFDSSRKRGQPATFPLNGVIKCWTEGVQMMKVGGKSRLVCPSDLAYGERGAPPRIKPGATLVFEVELLEIVK